LTLILFAMVSILLVAGVLLLYVAFPHRGRAIPRIPWVGEALRTAVLRLPTLDNQRAHENR
jgi:hypothetical protein